MFFAKANKCMLPLLLFLSEYFRFRFLTPEEEGRVYRCIWQNYFANLDGALLNMAKFSMFSFCYGLGRLFSSLGITPTCQMKIRTGK